jgi:hypothetical protein
VSARGNVQRRENGGRIDDALAHALLGDEGHAGIYAYRWDARRARRLGVSMSRDDDGTYEINPGPGYNVSTLYGRVRVKTLMRASDIVRHHKRTTIGTTVRGGCIACRADEGLYARSTIGDLADTCIHRARKQGTRTYPSDVHLARRALVLAGCGL